MHFPANLIQRRKAVDLTQQGLADAAALHVNQIRRYEAGSAQPTLEALIRLAKALHVTLDELVFAENARGPDDDLRLQFEALSAMSAEEKRTARAVLEAIIVKHQVTNSITGAIARTRALASTKPATKKKAPANARKSVTR